MVSIIPAKHQHVNMLSNKIRDKKHAHDAQTGFKQTPRLAKLIWKRKQREMIKLAPNLSVVN